MRGKIVGLAAAILAACATTAPWPQQVSDWCQGVGCTPEVRAAMLDGRVIRGMRWIDVNKMYGPPVRINRNSYGPEQHVYRKTCAIGPLYQESLFVYFENDVVVDWQDMGCR